MRRTRLRFPTVVAIALAGALAAVPASSQVPESTLREAFRIPLPPTTETLARGSAISPGISLSNPTGFGASQGDAFIGAGYQHRTRLFTRADGGVVVGFGLGDPRTLVGLEVAATTFGTVRSCCRGGIHLKVHRIIPGRASLALGWENALLWNDDEDRPATDAGESFYAAVTKGFTLREDGVHPFSSLVITAGAGNGRFRREGDVLDGRSTINPFVGVSTRLAERASAIGEWTGRDMAVGMSIVPFHDRPFFLTPGVADLTTRPRFILGLGFGFGNSGTLD